MNDNGSTIKTSSKTKVDRADVQASMRDGVKALAQVKDLPEALARLSMRPARDLGTRVGIEEVLAEVRRRFAPPGDTRPLLRISTTTPPEAYALFKQVRAVLDQHSQAGFLHHCRAPSKLANVAFIGREISGAKVVPEDAREAWDVAAAIAVACDIPLRRISSPRALALAATRALRSVKGRQRIAVAKIAALPHACALDPDAAAIAYAHAPRERGSVAVVVVKTSDASVWRSNGKTGIRPIAPRPWHRDPVVAAAMATCAQASVKRCAPYRVTATSGEKWTQALLAQIEDGFEAYLQRPDGRIDHVEVLGRGTWASLGSVEAARLAATSGRPVEERRVYWLTREEENDADQNGAEASFAALVAAGMVTQAQIRRFRFRVEGAVRRTRDAAILAFLTGLPPAAARLARLIRPVRSWDSKSNKRFALGRWDIEAAVAAATHPDPSAMVRAVENPSTRALVLAAGLRGPWRVAAEAVASGAAPGTTLLLYASAAIDQPLSRAAVKGLAGWPVSIGKGLGDLDRSFSDFTDLARLAAVLWVETPSRPPMTTMQLFTLAHGLKRFGFVPPSAAGPDDRTWDDPGTTTAYANALRRERNDVVGSASLAHGVADMIRFLDGKLLALGLARDAREAVRCVSLVPPGRLVPGLERMSDEWHRAVPRLSRERDALVEELTSEEVLSWEETMPEYLPENFPNPLSGEIVHGEVVIWPLRTPREIDREGEEMANCVSTYRDWARVGNLLLYHLESPFGRSTLGLVVSDGARVCEVDIYQHHGPQHHSVDAPPPPEHADTAEWLISSLARRDGGPGGPRWRSELLAIRRAHARSASLRPSEVNLSPARRRRLAELDLVHLGSLLGKHERRFDFDQFHRWAERLAGESNSRNRQ